MALNDFEQKVSWKKKFARSEINDSFRFRVLISGKFLRHRRRYFVTRHLLLASASCSYHKKFISWYIRWSDYARSAFHVSIPIFPDFPEFLLKTSDVIFIPAFELRNKIIIIIKDKNGAFKRENESKQKKWYLLTKH